MIREFEVFVGLERRRAHHFDARGRYRLGEVAPLQPDERLLTVVSTRFDVAQREAVALVVYGMNPD